MACCSRGIMQVMGWRVTLSTPTLWRLLPHIATTAATTTLASTVVSRPEASGGPAMRRRHGSVVVTMEAVRCLQRLRHRRMACSQPAQIAHALRVVIPCEWVR
jgi:hypothetical protein